MSDIHSFEPLFGSWYVEEPPLGKGNYGTVYRASRSELGLTFYSAIKHIAIEDNADYSSDQVVEALKREISINVQLRGRSHLVSFEDSTILKRPSGGYDVFIRMELLTSLPERMKSTPLTEPEVVRLGIDICDALNDLETQSIIHRDIKPANIFVSSTGSYKLGDFGVARSLQGTTGGMTIAGTFNYMAPEIYRGGRVNHTADIYSLGIVLYRLLNGNRAPFLPPPPAATTYDDANAALSRRMNGEPLPAPAFASPALAEVILRACAYDPNRRYQAAADFGQALHQVLNGTYVSGQAAPSATVYGGVFGAAPAPAPAQTYSEPQTPVYSAAPAGGYAVPASGSQNRAYAPVSADEGGGQNEGMLKGLIIGLCAVAVVLALVLVLYLTGVIGGRSPGSQSHTASTPVTQTPGGATARPTATPSGSSKTENTPAPQTEKPAGEAEEDVTPIFVVRASAGSGGSISPPGSTEVGKGQRITYTITPDPGYEIESVVIDGKEYGSGDTYSLTVNSDAEIYASFRKKESTYELFRTNVTWWTAYEDAEKRGGYLAAVTSQEEMDRLIDMAEDKGIQVLLIGGRVRWEDGSGTPLWMNGESFDFEPWFGGEPNNYGNEEDCLALMKRASDGTWGFCDVPNNAFEFYPGRSIVGYAVEYDG